MSRKSPTFGQLLAYMTIPERVGPSIAHNLNSDPGDLAAVHSEFLGNYRYLPNRKNGNVLYHEVLSFSDLDRQNVTPSIAEDLTRKYLDLRAPYALAYAQGHFQEGEGECPHIHIMISANNRESTRRVSLSRAEFAKVKQRLEQYQKTRYPFLEHSVVFDKQERTKALRQSRNESERDRRLSREDICREPSRKEQIRDLITEQLSAAPSAKGFRLRLKLFGLQLYQQGKTLGVQDLAGDPESRLADRRYQLKTLGLEELVSKTLDRWKMRPERLLAVQEQDLERSQQLWRKRGFRDQMLDVIALHSSELSPLERERLEEIHSLRANQKESEDRSPDTNL